MEQLPKEGYSAETTQTLEDIDALEKQDFYARLGVSRDASQDEVKKAFRNLSARFHPDRVHMDEEARENYSEVQKRLGEAYNTLSDASQKQRYDRGLSTAGADAQTQPYNETRNESPAWKTEAPLTSEGLWKLQIFDNALRERLTDGINIKKVNIDEVEKFVATNMRSLKDQGMPEKDILYKIQFPLLDYYSIFRKRDTSVIKIDSEQIKYALVRIGISSESIAKAER